ncbi:MAG: biotin--[acetyl-CoA-carboxylase] ligase [Chitinophagaceae bacterium]
MQQQPVIKPLGSPFIELSSVDSTNNYALAQIRNGLAIHGAAFFAHEQTAGKGQMGKQWKSEKDANIALSVVIQPLFLTLSQQFRLNACVAVAAWTFLSRYINDNLCIKWPNDLYWNDRKIGGILIENIITNQLSAASWQFAVAGTGLNINQEHFPSDLPNPASLKQITGKNYDTVALAKEFCTSLQEHFTLLQNDGFEKIYTTYNAVLYKRNETVKLKKGNIHFTTIINSVSINGQLVTNNGQFTEEFSFGEITWTI